MKTKTFLNEQLVWINDLAGTRAKLGGKGSIPLGPWLPRSACANPKSEPGREFPETDFRALPPNWSAAILAALGVQQDHGVQLFKRKAGGTPARQFVERL